MITDWIERGNDALNEWPFRWVSLIVIILLMTYTHLYHILYEHHYLPVSQTEEVEPQNTYDASCNKCHLTTLQQLRQKTLDNIKATNAGLTSDKTKLPEGYKIITDGTGFKWENKTYHSTFSFDTYNEAVEYAVKNNKKDNTNWVEIQ